jgi:hypothetical protein
MPTTSLVGAILLIAHLTGYITGWGWPILYICLLFMGHSTEYRDMFLPWRK